MFFPVIMVVAVFTGFGPGVMATLLTDFAVGHWMLPPMGESATGLVDDRVGLFIFTGSGIFMSWMARVYRRDQSKAKERLRQSLERFRMAAETANDVVYEWDLKDHLQWFGDIDKLLGHEPGQFPRTLKAWTNAIHPEDRERVMASVQAQLKAGTPYAVEYRIQNKSGEYGWWSARGMAVRNPDGEPVRWIGTVTDITERKRTEASLAEERNRFKALVNHLPLAVYMKDLAGRKILTNPVDAAHLGAASEAEVVGQTDGVFFPPEKAAQIEAQERQIFTTDQPLINSEECQRMRDGTLRWLLVSKIPLFDAANKPAGLVGFTLDITENKRTEEAHARLAAAVEQSAEAIVITDTEGKIIYTNPAFEKTTGYTCAEALGQSPRLLKSGKQDAEFYRRMWDTLKCGDTWRGHFSNQRKDGTIYQEEATITPIRNGSGTITSYVAVKRDVTREEMLESQVRQAQKMEAIGTLVGGIAHDFNNILGAILGYSHMLQQDTADNFAAQENNAEVIKAANRAKDLVQQILTFSRRRETDRKEVMLDGILNEALKFLRASLPTGIEIDMRLAAEAPAVLADLTQIYQVVVNLATNALHAMEGHPGRLTVSLEPFQPDPEFIVSHAGMRENTRYARLTVGDTGCGMSAETLERIFEPFFTTKPVGKGTGLGLAVVHGIVHAHGGIITVESEKCKGTTFCIYFPGIKLEARVNQTRQREVPRGQGQKILLVDDETMLTTMLEKVLNRLNYEVVVANHPQKALELMRANLAQFDLVITDFTMPVMTGLELAKQIHILRPDLPTIMASGYSATLDPATLQVAGIRELLEKPVAEETLAKAMQGALGKAGRKQKEGLVEGDLAEVRRQSLVVSRPSSVGGHENSTFNTQRPMIVNGV